MGSLYQTKRHQEELNQQLIRYVKDEDIDGATEAYLAGAIVTEDALRTALNEGLEDMFFWLTNRRRIELDGMANIVALLSNRPIYISIPLLENVPNDLLQAVLVRLLEEDELDIARFLVDNALVDIRSIQDQLAPETIERALRIWEEEDQRNEDSNILLVPEANLMELDL